MDIELVMAAFEQLLDGVFVERALIGGKAFHLHQNTTKDKISVITHENVASIF